MAGIDSTSKVHKNCVCGIYPQSKVKRYEVTADKIKWTIQFPEYSPPNYTSEKLKGASYADPDIEDREFHPNWNKKDGVVNRVSYEGEYVVMENVPQNPVGRTGLKRRGKLGRWGPNHAGDPVITRWKTDKNGNLTCHTSEEKPILQVVVIQRNDNDEWAFPGGMLDPGETDQDAIKREFREEALDSSQLDEQKKAQNNRLLEDNFVNGEEVYRGYVDDPRNTDNAWMETVAINYHDQSGSTLGRLNLKAGSDAKVVQWKDANHELRLYANHSEILQKVAKRLNARW